MKRTLSLAMAFILCVVLAVPAFAATTEQTAAADRLYSLDLFRGVGANKDGTPNFDLDRAPTRAEAVTMLVRLLGKEDEAQAGTWSTPFTDVPPWAAPYVGYAYEHGYTNGMTTTTFGPSLYVSATQYLTFILRALGYTSGEDFKWDSAWTLTDQLGITSGQYNAKSNFTRGDAALVSSHALDTKVKSGSGTLLSTIQAGSTTNPQPSTPQPGGGKFPPSSATGTSYVLNTHTMKFHHPGCGDVDRISSENRYDFVGDRNTLLEYGYSPCGHCDP